MIARARALPRARSAFALLAALLVAATASTAGCARRASADAPVANGLDSLRGTVRLVGAAPGVLVLEGSADGAVDLAAEDVAADAARRAAADAALAAALRAADGLEVAVFGRTASPSGLTPSRSGFAVARFAVRAVDGLAAVDGVLERDGASYRLRLVDGTRARLAPPPEPLRAAVGARVYWAGALDAAPVAYGILARP